MPEYSYKAVDNNGLMLTGSIFADDTSSARIDLKNRGMIPVSIDEAGNRLRSLKDSHLFQRKIKKDVLAYFCRQLAVAISSGVNIMIGLDILAKQTPNKAMRSEASRIYHDVQTGMTVGESMKRKNSMIPEMLASMVATGEATGSLDTVLRSMASFYDREHRIAQKIVSASVYPIVMLFIAGGLLVFFFNFLMPQIIGMITESGGQLPLITRFVVGVSEIMQNYFIQNVLVLTAVVLGIVIFIKTPSGRYLKDQLIFVTPLLGKTIRSVATLRLARTAYILIHNGYPLLEGLEFVKKNVGNALAEKSVNFAIEGLTKGEPMGENLEKGKYFDGMAIQMFVMGEQTGELEKILSEMVEFYEQEADLGFSKLIALVEPMMLVIIGGIVSFVILSVMVPMMTMFSNLKVN